MEWRATLALVVAFPALLEGELLPIRSYSTADGLAADHVDCVVSDSRGFMWFCTPEGLSRFDGNHFVNYGLNEGLPHQFISGVLETRSGDHWIGTARGLVRINSGEGAPFTTYQPGQKAKQNVITTLVETRSGELLCGTAEGLFAWRPPRSFLPRGSPTLDPMTITAIAEGPDGTLWLGTLGGIYVLRDNAVVRNFRQEDGLPGLWVEDLLADSEGRIWAAVRGGLALFTKREPASWEVERVYREAQGLLSRGVSALYEATDGTLWVGTAVGISRLTLKTDNPGVFQNLTREQGLSDRQILALGEDPAGNIWAGTEGAGIMRIARLGFSTYREPDGLKSDRLMSVFEDRGGELLAVTDTGPGGQRSIDILSGGRFHSAVPKVFGNHAGWGTHHVVLQSHTGEWWAATKEGLCRYGPVEAEDLDRRGPRVCYEPQSEVFQLFEDSKGGLWASAQSKVGDLLMRWDADKNKVVELPPRTPGSRPDDLVATFAEDRLGNLWMGLMKGGLYRYDGRGFQYLQRKDGIPAGAIAALLVDRQGGLWVGSSAGGLGHIANTKELHPRIEIYDIRRGMASNTIQCLVEDRQGRIYAGTGKGVDRLDPKTGHVQHFSAADGLAHGQFQSAIRDRSGALWFATTQGLSKLTATEDRRPAAPRILITDLQVAGAPYPVSQVGETRISELDLKPSQNQLRVDFVGVDYEPGETIRYSYKLEGADADFSAPRNQQTVNYAALTAGTYRFLVKAVNSEGVESSAPAEIDFRVLPPLWRRWWFEGLALALAAGLVLAAHRYRVTQMVSLERMRTAIATDLHDDIGASLSQIAILSEVARVGANGSGQAKEPLERIASLARELVDSMGDIVWSIRSDPHSMESLIRRMREFALDLLGSQGIGFELHTPSTAEEMQLGLQVRRQLFLIFKECIHNAARHSRCTQVSAELRVAAREIVLTVQDNGRGLEPGARQPGSNGTGIPSMQKRAESLGGRLEITSAPGEGCRISAFLPARPGALV